MQALSKMWLRRRSRGVWIDPRRKVRTLEGFSQTELDGGQDILAAARRTRDPKLREHFERHAADEMRHGEMFRERAKELRLELGDGPGHRLEPDKLYDLSNSRGGDSHGFLSADQFDELGEIAYVAMLHVAEQKAAQNFEVHHQLNQHDPETRAVFEQILKDELYHVSYTKTFLDKWDKEGHRDEVKAALKKAREWRLMSAWKRLGARSGEHFSRVLLLLFYFVFVTPFALIAKAQARPEGWQDAGQASDLTSQF